MEGTKDQHFVSSSGNQEKGLGLQIQKPTFGSLIFRPDQVLDGSDIKNGDELSQVVRNLPLKDSSNGDAEKAQGLVLNEEKEFVSEVFEKIDNKINGVMDGEVTDDKEGDKEGDNDGISIDQHNRSRFVNGQNEAKKIELNQWVHQICSKFEDKSKNENILERPDGNDNLEGDSMESKDGKHKKYYYPLRPDADNCPFFMRNGFCRYGSNCKFNHPFKRRSQENKDISKPKEENLNRTGQVECKYHLSSEGCKNGKACRFYHRGGKTAVAPVLEINFLGLPIRPGEKECSYYMQNGSCKYGLNCWYDHPDLPSMGGDAPLYGYNGMEDTMPFWSIAGTLNEIAPLGPHIYQPERHSPYSEWNGYQVPFEHHEPPIYTTSGRSLPTPPAFPKNTPASDANSCRKHQQRVLVKESIERQRQPERSSKIGFRFHHPETSSCTLNDKGLPLRPDKEVCAFYDRYGVCKHGPACKFDHPVTRGKSVPAAGFEKAELLDPTTEDKN